MLEVDYSRVLTNALELVQELRLVIAVGHGEVVVRVRAGLVHKRRNGGADGQHVGGPVGGWADALSASLGSCGGHDCAGQGNAVAERSGCDEIQLAEYACCARRKA